LGRSLNSGHKLNNPTIGPLTRNSKTIWIFNHPTKKLVNWILMMVMKNPMLVTMVNADPTKSRGAV
jgi:hypothetical protein